MWTRSRPKLSSRTTVLATMLSLLGCPSSDDAGGGGESSGGLTSATTPTGTVTSGTQSTTEQSGTMSASGDASTGATTDTPETTSTDTTGPTSGTTQGTVGESTMSGDDTGPGKCVESLCDGDVWACGDCIDNDGDGNVDTFDSDCFGPCDNNEEGWSGEIPGQDQKCKQDCYFDENSGAGNDECHWSHECDPFEPSVLTDPGCEYDPDANVPGTGLTCEELLDEQSPECLDQCLPLTPNGCDCFGCCEVGYGNDQSITVYLGTENEDGDGTCNLTNLLDPVQCAVCTQVPACLNPCVEEECELCFAGELPKECDEPGCPAGLESCFETADCPAAHHCLTGCCFPDPG